MFIAYTGGATVALPKENEKSHVVTMFHVHGHENDTNVLEEFDKVVDFVFLPRQEEPSTKRKQPFSINFSKLIIVCFIALLHLALLAVLTESELVVLDTSTEKKFGYGLMRL